MLCLTDQVGFAVVTDVDPKVLTYQTATSSNTDASSYSFLAQAIGPAATGRRVIVGISARWAGGARTVSATIGGVAATLIAPASSPSNFALTVIAIAEIPTGTTADVAVTFSGGSVQTCGIGVWSATGLALDTPNASGTSTTSGGPSLSISTLSGGFVVAVFSANSGSGSVAWTGVNERYDSVPEAGFNPSGGDAVTVGGNLTVTAANTAGQKAMSVATW